MSFAGTFRVSNALALAPGDFVTITATGAVFSLSATDYTLDEVAIAAVSPITNGVTITIAKPLTPGSLVRIAAGVTGGTNLVVQVAKRAAP